MTLSKEIEINEKIRTRFNYFDEDPEIKIINKRGSEVTHEEETLSDTHGETETTTEVCIAKQVVEEPAAGGHRKKRLVKKQIL